MNGKEPYHGWLIEVIPQPAGYSFRCWFPEEKIAVSDRQIYSTSAYALRVAKVRADLEAVRWALTHFLNEAYQEQQLSPDEHVALASSIIKFVASVSKKSH